jgi:hypothetical protein
VCDCSDQAAHYHNLGPNLGASLLTRHFGCKQKKKERKKERKITIIQNYTKVKTSPLGNGGESKDMLFIFSVPNDLASDPIKHYSRVVVQIPYRHNFEYQRCFSEAP